MRELGLGVLGFVVVTIVLCLVAYLLAGTVLGLYTLFVSLTSGVVYFGIGLAAAIALVIVAIFFIKESGFF